VDHSKESNVEAFQIIESEPTLTLQKLSSFPLFSPIIVLFRIIYYGNHVRSGLYNPDCISFFWTTYKTCFKRFGRWSCQKTCFYTFFDCIKCRYTLCNHSLPINTLQTLHNLSHQPLLLFLSCNHGFSSLAFHRKRPLWSFSGIVWTINEDGTNPLPPPLSPLQQWSYWYVLWLPCSWALTRLYLVLGSYVISLKSFNIIVILIHVLIKWLLFIFLLFLFLFFYCNLHLFYKFGRLKLKKSEKT